MTRLVFSLLFLSAPAVLSFAPIAKIERPKTAIDAISRRESLAAASVAAGAFVGGFVNPKPSLAFSQQLDDYVIEPSQLSTGGKFDLNAAGVVSTIFYFAIGYIKELT